MPAEQWVSNIIFPIALIVSLYTFGARNVWPYYTKRRDTLDQQEHERKMKIDAQYEERHVHYVGSIDKVESLLAQIAQRLMDSDDRVIAEVKASKIEIIDYIDKKLSPPFDPRDSKTRIR